MLVGLLIGWAVGVLFSVLFFQLVAAAQQRSAAGGDGSGEAMGPG